MDEEKIVTEDQNTATDSEMKEKLSKEVEKLRNHAMVLGGKAIATVIYNMIQKFHLMPGKRTLNDHRRLIKEIEKFCKTAVDKEIETPKFGEDDTNES